MITACIREDDATDPTRPSRLRSLYGLSRVEAEIAERLAAGASVAEISRERRTSVQTVRTQVKAVASKLACGRQAEIAAIVNGIPHLSGL